MAFVTFTNEGGQPAQLESSLVVRMRHILPYEAAHHAASTKVTWTRDSFAKEQPDQIAQLLLCVPGVASWLAQLALPKDRLPLWFNGKQASGPISVTSNMPPGTNSAFLLSGKAQPVANTHQEVQDMIKDKGGNPLPIPMAAILGFPSDKREELQYEIWDSELPNS